MENREQQILSEIKTMMSSIRIQLEKLDAKMAELQQVVDPDDVAIDLDIDMPVMPQEELIEDDLPFVETPAEEAAEPEYVTEPVMESEPVSEPEPEPVVEPAPAPVEEDDDDLPLFSEPKPIYEVALESPKTRKAVIDVLSQKEAWRTDMAGSPVRDLLSAISLNDRVQFINVLFNEDPVIFQQTRAKINMMHTLDEVVAYLTSNFEWDMSSPVVYRFMMAVRRKVQG